MSSYTSPTLVDPGWTQWVDVDFGREASHTGYLLGCLPTPDRLSLGALTQLPVYEESFPVYPRSQWPDLIAQRDADGGAGWQWKRIRRQHDQGKEGTCVYNALSLCAQIKWCQQFGGRLWIPFSPVSGYHWNAPSPRTGSNVGDSILWLANKGLLPEDTEANLALVAKGYFKHTHPAVGYYESFQDGWQKTAALFRAMPAEKGGWYRVKTVEGWFSSLFDGNVCSGGRDYHCITHCGAVMDGSSVLSLFCNSWGKWGATMNTDAGPIQSFGFDSISKVATMVAREGFCLVSMRRPSFLDRWVRE